MLKGPEKSEEELNSKEIKKSGYFLYADYFDAEKLDEVKQLLKKYFDIVRSENITANVFHAVKIDGKQRKERIRKQLGCLYKPMFRFYKDLYEDFKAKQKVYYAFVLTKK
jgi:hypothetical protein